MRLERYIFKEVLGPAALGLLVYTFILMMNFLFAAAGMIIRRGLPVSEVAKLLLLSLPNVIVITIPMAVLFGILVGVGRLSADGELTAIRASGGSLYWLYRPILALTLLIATVNAFLMLDVVPRANHELQQVKMDQFARSVGRQVQPRVFHDAWPGFVLYVFDTDPETHRWRGVFLAEDTGTNETQITVAEWGQVRVDSGDEERLILELEDSIIHKVEPKNPTRYTSTTIASTQKVLEEGFLRKRRAGGNVSKGLRELTLPELHQRLSDPGLHPRLRRLMAVEIHKKFSIPAACLVFGLLGLPLGFSGKRGGRSAGFALSLAVVAAYWIFLTMGENAAGAGDMSPWLAMWLPNLVLGALGLYLLQRRNADRPLLGRWLDGWIRRNLSLRVASVRSRRIGGSRPRQPKPPATASATPSRHDVLLRLPRVRLRFPNMLDRYVIRRFAWVFLMAMLSGLVLYIVGDLSGQMDNVLNNSASGQTVFDYYKYLSLQIVFEIAPIMVLIATLVTFGLLSRTNEVIAAKALGMSLYRLSVPAVAAAAVISLFCVYLQAEILPATNDRVAQLRDQIRGTSQARTYRRSDRQWLFGQGRYIYNYRSYDAQRKTLNRLQVFEFDENFQLTRRLFAETAEYVGNAWIFHDSWKRTFDRARVLEFQRFDHPVIDAYPETPDYFETELRSPEQMTYGELKHHIAEVAASGQDVTELRVQLGDKVAFPINSLVMALVALPFAFRMGRKGALYGIGIAIVVGMVFLSLYKVSFTLGETGALPASVAVWSPVVLFGLWSGYLFLGVET